MKNFDENGIKNGKLSKLFRERQTEHPMEVRDPDINRTTRVHKERFF